MMFGVKVNEILNRMSEDPAIFLALGETKVIMETKKALAKAGVNVTSLEKIATGEGNETKRSNHIVLVNKLPFTATEKELAQMFGKFGSIDKIILPPTKALALVEFSTNQEALNAKGVLAGYDLYGCPLVLEWAKEDAQGNEEKEKLDS